MHRLTQFCSDVVFYLLRYPVQLKVQLAAVVFYVITVGKLFTHTGRCRDILLLLPAADSFNHPALLCATF